MAATLTVTPNPTSPSNTVTVTGTGFTNAKTRLSLDGEGTTSNIFRPKKDGTFTVGINVSSTPRTQLLVAQQLQSGIWTEVARLFVVVQATATAPTVAPANFNAIAGDSKVTLTWGV